MATPFFPKTWEDFTPEELTTARARLAGFVEAVPDKEKILREVIAQNHLHIGESVRCENDGFM